MRFCATRGAAVTNQARNRPALLSTSSWLAALAVVVFASPAAAQGSAPTLHTIAGSATSTRIPSGMNTAAISGIAVDGAGNVYVARHGLAIVKIDTAGSFTTVAGLAGTSGFGGDGGPAAGRGGGVSGGAGRGMAGGGGSAGDGGTGAGRGMARARLQVLPSRAERGESPHQAAAPDGDG